MPIINLFEESYQLKERGQAQQRCINWNYEKYEGDGSKTKTASALAKTLGAQIVAAMGASSSDECRGLYLSSTGTAPDFAPRIYGVWGNTLYRFGTDNITPYVIGYVTDNGLPVSMTDNGQGRYFFIVDGMSAYSSLMADADGLASLVVVAMPKMPLSVSPIQPTHCGFIGQRIVVNGKGSSYFFYGDLTNPVTMDGGTVFQDGNFYSDESSGDIIKALGVVNGSFLTLGFRSYSLWSVTNNQDNPLSVTSGTSNAVGIEASYSLGIIDNMAFWLASSDVGGLGVYMLQNTTLTRISTQGIDEVLMDISNRSTAQGYAYSLKGAIFYVLSFIGSNRTFVYEVTVNKWHERLSRDFASGEWRAWPYNWIIQANGKMLAGVAFGASKFVELRDDVYTEYDGRQIVREGTSKVFFDDMLPVCIQELTIDMQVGETLVLTGQGSNPVIMLQISKDGGASWSSISTRTIGKQGNYRKKVSWTGLGTAINWAFRVTLSDPVPCMLYQTKIRYTKGLV